MNHTLKRIAPYVVPATGVALAVGTLFLPQLAFAQITGDKLGTLGIKVYAGSSSFLTIVANLINFALFLAGLVAFIFVLYGGFVYLTAGGDSARAGTGRTIIVNAIVGILIIFISWILVRYFANLTQNNGNPGSGGTGIDFNSSNSQP